MKPEKQAPNLHDPQDRKIFVRELTIATHFLRTEMPLTSEEIASANQKQEMPELTIESELAINSFSSQIAAKRTFLRAIEALRAEK